MKTLHQLRQNASARLKGFGKAPLCSTCDPKRAPHVYLFGRIWCFPLCWRCVSLFCGLELAARLLTGVAFLMTHAPILGVLAVLPCLIDGVLQYGFDVTSTNPRRITTGLLGGIGTHLLLIAMFSM